MDVGTENVDDIKVAIYRSGMYVVYNSRKHGRETSELKKIANKKRYYSINRQKVRSASISLFQNKKSKNLLFLTYTFAFDVKESDASAIWQNHLDNLKKTFKVNNYVWVKEEQKHNNNRIHYHILIDRNRINIKNLQDSFNHSVRHICNDAAISNNSIRLGSNPIVSEINKVAKYLSKYIAKSEDNVFESKAYGHSDLEIKRTIDFIDFYNIIRQKKCFTFIDEPYLTVGFVENYIDYPPNST
jgi:hypothetical protein